MKFLLIFSTLVSVSWCSGGQNGEITEIHGQNEPTVTNMPQCNPAIFEWLPHPKSCIKYILCFHGKPIEKICAPGLEFNGKQAKCILSQEQCCPKVDDPNNLIFSADVNDCTKYSVCYSGEAVPRSCAKGLFFDVNSNWCTTPNNVNCDPRTTNAPNIKQPNLIDLSNCQWYGSVLFQNGTYVKSLCYYDQLLIHSDAIDNCHKLGMRLMRIKDSAVQTATIAYLLTRFEVGTNGIYHVSGTNINSTWHHEDNTPVYENMRWKNGKKPELENLAFSNYNPWYFETFPKTHNLHSICEFNLIFKSQSCIN